MIGSANGIPCVGCGAMVPDINAPTHPYIGASPGCWKFYGDVLGREYGELRNPPWHRLTVDAYAAQHPGSESRRSIQSVAVHLIALHLVLDQQLDPLYVTRRMSATVAGAEKYHWLEPPDFDGTLSIVDVAAAAEPDRHEQAVRQWATGVWQAWRGHHATVASWAT